MERVVSQGAMADRQRPEGAPDGPGLGIEYFSSLAVQALPMAILFAAHQYEQRRAEGHPCQVKAAPMVWPRPSVAAERRLVVAKADRRVCGEVRVEGWGLSSD